MRQGTCVFDELCSAEASHVGDPFHWTRAHVRRKLLVTKNSEAFLQAKLEPIAARDAVASPIVEIFMRNHSFDMGKVCVCRGVSVRQDIFVIENVKTLVLHR